MRAYSSKYRFVWAFAAIVLAACGGDTGDASVPEPPLATPVFEHDGLDGAVVQHLYSHGDRLFAATQDGLYGKFLGQNVWVSLGLSGLQIQGFAIVDDQHWIAATFPTAQLFVDPKLYETVNGGGNWLQVENDFGPGETQSEAMMALLYDQETKRLFATGLNTLASSADYGRTWLLLDGQWGSTSVLQALDLNSMTQQIWLGGQNAIEGPILRQYDLNTFETVAFAGLFPSPSAIKSATFDPLDPGRVLVAGEGGVLQSADNGNSWTNLLGNVDHRFYFRALLDPQNSNIIYTAGWTKTDMPQPLILEVSRNRGTSWERHQMAAPDLFGGVWSMLATTENNRTVLYLGLNRGGIVRVRL
jgi:photosystem II stability/assembly factor-like uncharacterized protein